MIKVIIVLGILLIGVAAYLFLLSASRLNREAEEMYDNDLKDLKKQGVIK